MGTSHMSNSSEETKKKVPSKALVITGIAIVAALIGVAIFIVTRPEKPSPKVESVVSNAQKAFDKGDYSKSYDQLVAALPQAKTKADKIRLYDQIAVAASSSGKITEAIKYYEMKHRLDAGLVNQDAYFLGTLYDRNGETAKALIEYKRALAYLKQKPQSIQTTSDAEALTAIIAEMEKK
jgi:tetratricopeptide (TPR) repeat protein